MKNEAALILVLSLVAILVVAVSYRNISAYMPQQKLCADACQASYKSGGFVDKNICYCTVEMPW